MPTQLTTPLVENEYYWFLKHIHWRMQPPYNKHFAVAVASESGGGKSYNTMSCAYALYPDFKPEESIAFNARRFLEISKENHRAGFPLILDDAGLTAFSGDALTKEVGAISKIAQSIRHKNWQVYLNLPNLDLLAKSVRITNHYYIEPVWIDYDERLCYSKFQRMSTNPKGGDKLKFKSLRKWVSVTNPNTGYEQMKKRIYLTIPIPHPPEQIAKDYEKMKEENMQTFREETRVELEKRHDAKMAKKINTNDIAKIISSNPEAFMMNNKFSVKIIAKKFKIPASTAYQIMKVL